jgi:predicted oxidoreductase
MNVLQYPKPAIGLWRLTEWQMDAQQLLRWTQEVLELGASVFDLADIYGDYEVEAAFGRALRLQPALRSQLFLISKCGILLLSGKRPAHRLKYYDTSHAHLVASVENSLRELHTDRLDLLLLHRPDALMDADEVAATMTELRAAGKVLHFGVSNFTASQVELLASRLAFPLLTNQFEFSVLRTAPLYDGTLDQCQRLRMSPMAWSPLGGGTLFSGQGEREQRVRAALASVGRERGGWSLDQTALAWLLTHPSRVVPVLGTRNPANIRAALSVAAEPLARDQWYAILQAIEGHEVP